MALFDTDRAPTTWAEDVAGALGIEVTSGPSWLPVPIVGSVPDPDVTHLDGWLETDRLTGPVRLAASDYGHDADVVALHIECGRWLAETIIRILAEHVGF